MNVSIKSCFDQSRAPIKVTSIGAVFSSKTCITKHPILTFKNTIYSVVQETKVIEIPYFCNEFNLIIDKVFVSRIKTTVMHKQMFV
jgi:hypothetical protein